MICYLDRTFCDQGAACKCEPYRRLTEEHVKRAKELGFYVAMANFCGEKQELAQAGEGGGGQ